MKNIINRKTIENNLGIIVLGILILIFIVFTTIYLISTKNISSIEKKELLEINDDLIYYIEDISLSNSKDIDKYIIYALDYSYNTNSRNKMTCDEIYNFLSEHFTIKTSVEQIKNMGISPLMLERNITYDNSDDSYVLNVDNLDAKTISETPIVYYKLQKITKSNKKKFVIKYKKYVIENPYDMLNYYIEKNTNVEGTETEDGIVYDLVDIVPIRNYLLGNGRIIDLKKSINDEDISKYAKSSGTLKVTFVVKDDKILIDKIK